MLGRIVETKGGLAIYEYLSGPVPEEAKHYGGLWWGPEAYQLTLAQERLNDTGVTAPRAPMPYSCWIRPLYPAYVLAPLSMQGLMGVGEPLKNAGEYAL